MVRTKNSLLKKRKDDDLNEILQAESSMQETLPAVPAPAGSPEESLSTLTEEETRDLQLLKQGLSETHPGFRALIDVLEEHPDWQVQKAIHHVPGYKFEIGDKKVGKQPKANRRRAAGTDGVAKKTKPSKAKSVLETGSEMTLLKVFADGVSLEAEEKAKASEGGESQEDAQSLQPDNTIAWVRQPRTRTLSTIFELLNGDMRVEEGSISFKSGVIASFETVQPPGPAPSHHRITLTSVCGDAEKSDASVVYKGVLQPDGSLAPARKSSLLDGITLSNASTQADQGDGSASQ